MLRSETPESLPHWGGMPRYYYNVFDDSVAVDDEGLELPDIAAARVEALRGARSIIAEQVARGRICLNCRIEVEDADRRPVLTLPFTEAVKIGA